MNYAEAKQRVERFVPMMQAGIDRYAAALAERETGNAAIEQELKSIEHNVRRKIKRSVNLFAPGYQVMAHVACGNWIQHGKRPVVIVPKILMRYACGGVEVRVEVPIDEALDFAIGRFVAAGKEALPLNRKGANE